MGAIQRALAMFQESGQCFIGNQVFPPVERRGSKAMRVRQSENVVHFLLRDAALPGRVALVAASYGQDHGLAEAAIHDIGSWQACIVCDIQLVWHLGKTARDSQHVWTWIGCV